MTLERLNIVDVETKWGYRSFELYQGDITALTGSVDLLVVSAFANNYYPTPSSVIGALAREAHISVETLAKKPELDLKQAFGCWVSSALAHPIFKRLLCLEFIGTGFGLGQVFDNLFIVLGVLELQGLKISTLALPMLGTGNQRIPYDDVISELLKTAHRSFQTYQYLERILFVAYDPLTAQYLDQVINQRLQRVDVVIPRGQLMTGIRQDILNKTHLALQLTDETAQETLEHLKRLVSTETSRSFELGVAARRLTELIADQLLGQTNGKSPGPTLHRKIGLLKEQGIAEWITSYMHVLRVFGNESAHHQDQASRRPAVISESDLALCLFCVERLLEFWLSFLEDDTAP